MKINQIIGLIWTNRVIFAAIVSVVTLVSILLAFIAKPVYRSEITVVQVPDDGTSGGLGSLASQFGGIASLAGVALPKGQSWDLAVSTLKSRHIIEQLISKHDLLPILFAKEWDRGTQKWRSNLNRIPTMADAVQKMRNFVLQVREDSKTGVVTVRMDWYDPESAAVWANSLVSVADEELRDKAVSNATTALTALTVELSHAEEAELRTAIARLMESQIKAKMIAGIRKEYAFRVIDQAIPSDRDKRVQPTRKSIVLVGAILGTFLAFLAVFLKNDWWLATRASG